MQKQLESRILEVERAKQQDQEERRKAMSDVEKQVRLVHCARESVRRRPGARELHPSELSPDSLCRVPQVCELQRSLKASQAEQQEALERAASAVTLEQKAIQDSLLQVS